MRINGGENRIETALLLAAGTGNRLWPLTNDSPKCLTEVNETAILGRLVDILRALKFKRLVVVVGHLDGRIRQFLDRNAGDLAIEYVHSDQYRTTNNIYSLWKARDVIHSPFLLLECDLIFDEALLDGMLQPDRIAISRILPWMNGTTVSLDDSNRVTRFHFGGDCQNRVTYKTVNIYSFSVASWRQVAQRLEFHISAGHVNDYYETVLSELIASRDLSLEAVFFDDRRWYEIDTIDDLRQAELLFPRSNGLQACSVFDQ